MEEEKPIDLFVACGEISGDIHAAELIQALLKQNPNLSIVGITGSKLRQLPVKTFMEMESLQVFGFWDIVRFLPKLMGLFFKLRSFLLKTAPKAVLFVDYPGFNLRMQKALRKKGFKGKLIHYICPTVWAWGKKRIHTMKNTLDLLLTIFPFETELFPPSLPTYYVKNPLLSYLEKYAYQSLKARRHFTIGIFPGSRVKEIERNLPLQLELAQEMIEFDPSIHIYLSVTNSVLRQKILPLVKQKSYALQKASIFSDSSTNYDLMRSIDLAIATSGTITLELALHKVPTLVNYAIKPLDLFLAQKIFRIHLDYYCIVNILAERLIFPEFYGPNFSKAKMLPVLKELYLNAEKRKALQNDCNKVKEILESPMKAISPEKKILSLLQP